MTEPISPPGGRAQARTIKQALPGQTGAAAIVGIAATIAAKEGVDAEYIALGAPAASMGLTFIGKFFRNLTNEFGWSRFFATLAVVLLVTGGGVARAAELTTEWKISHANAVADTGSAQARVSKGGDVHTKIASTVTTADFTQEITADNMIEKVCLATKGSAVVLSFRWIPGGTADAAAKTHEVIEASLDSSTPCAYNLSRGTYYAKVTTNASVADAILSIVTYQATQ